MSLGKCRNHHHREHTTFPSPQRAGASPPPINPTRFLTQATAGLGLVACPHCCRSGTSYTWSHDGFLPLDIRAEMRPCGALSAVCFSLVSTAVHCGGRRWLTSATAAGSFRCFQSLTLVGVLPSTLLCKSLYRHTCCVSFG